MGATGWRALADVALKREILFSHHDEPRQRGRDWVVQCITCDEAYPCQTLRIAVAVYRDHPGYRAEWRPHDPDLR